ncbi:nephrocystin-4-like isoform X2 [Anneissia japonica]|uniref:nephrocystin-4-like isoform X2 n=1 Tax=Anneissia japonica TaxID=1529436 RepID=UPI00142572F5|nr:nephrocystin-4-like isoform X2 [Anneissia japonica]
MVEMQRSSPSLQDGSLTVPEIVVTRHVTPLAKKKSSKQRNITGDLIGEEVYNQQRHGKEFSHRSESPARFQQTQGGSELPDMVRQSFGNSTFENHYRPKSGRQSRQTVTFGGDSLTPGSTLPGSITSLIYPLNEVVEAPSPQTPPLVRIVQQSPEELRILKSSLNSCNHIKHGYQESSSEEQSWVAFVIVLQDVQNIKSSPQLDGTSKKPEYEIRLSLFDITYKRFFGKTWKGPKKACKGENTGNPKLQYNTPVYFHTSLTDPNIVLVVEVVGTIFPKSGDAQQISCGWGLLRPFEEDDIPDTSQGKPAPTQKVDLMHGTPRALLYVDGDIEDNPSMLLISDCHLTYTIKSHRYMEKIMHLLPENVIVGGSDIVPGVAIADPETGGDNFRKLRPLKKFPATLDRLQINLYPTLDRFEDELCKLINNDRMARDDLKVDSGSVAISERRLQIGVHNGWGYVNKPHIVLLDTDAFGSRGSRSSMRKSKGRPSSAGSRESLGATLVMKNKVQLQDLVQDPLYSIVFVLEYILNLPMGGAQEKKLSASFNHSQTMKVCLRWASWSPVLTENQTGVILPLQGGPILNPDNTFMFKVPDPDVAESSKANGQIQFFFKLKTLAGSRPTSPMSLLSDPLVKGQLEVRPDHRGQYPSMQSLRSHTTTDGSVVGEMHPGMSARPPLPRQVSPTPRINRQQHISSTQAYQQQMAYQQQAAQMQTAQMQAAQMQAAQMQASQMHTGLSTAPQAYQQPYQQSYPSIQPNPYQPMQPMEIRHLEASTVLPEKAEQLEELPFTPVHAPIMPMGPNQKSGPGLSRAAYARLYAAGFPEIKDRHGQPPEVVEPVDHVAFHPEKENADQLQCNEIIIQILAFGRVLQFQQAASGNTPKTVFFTFQFYRYPQVTTARMQLGDVEGKLSVDPQALPCVLRRISNDKSLDNKPGWMIKYNVDPSYLKSGEGSLFFKYLYQQTLHIDVWDGDSLLLIGSCAIDLKHLLRCGREAVQVSQEVNIITTEYSDDSPPMTGDLSRGGSVRAIGVQTVLRGRLHLRLANVGHMPDAKTLKVTSLTLKESKVVVQEDGSGAFLGGSLNMGSRKAGEVKQFKMSRTIAGQGLASLQQKRSYRASHMTETDRELASALFSRQDMALQESNRECDAVKLRKLARMKALRQIENTSNGTSKSVLLKKEERVQRNRDLKTIMMYRDRTKNENILNMLQSVITTEHTVHPSFGHAQFFEFVLKNPYNVEHTISIQSNDPELSVITEPREWRHFKQLFETFTPMEENMFNTQDKKGDVPGLQIFLRPKEKVNVPFKYQSFQADHSVNPQGPDDDSKPFFKIQTPYQDKKVDLTLQSKVLKVYFKTQDDKSIAILSLHVEPQPHVLDQTFRFNHPEHSFLKKSIRLPPFQNLPGVPVSGPGLEKLYVKCSDDNVICNTKNVSPGEPQDVFLKVACGASPEIKKFFVLIYSTPYLSRPLQTWQFYVHSLQRVDVNSVEGQTSRFSLILRGTQASRLVQAFSSHPLEMQLAPADPFMLLANSVHEINVGVRPISVGSKFMYINVVDNEYHQLIRSWLVCVSCRLPIITKAFELQLPVGGGKGSNKRITYTNPYPQKKIYNIRCNRDDLLQFKETRIELAGGETCTLGLRFSPSHQSGSTEILIFINDEFDKNEETFCVRAIYS